MQQSRRTSLARAAAARTLTLARPHAEARRRPSDACCPRLRVTWDPRAMLHGPVDGVLAEGAKRDYSHRHRGGGIQLRGRNVRETLHTAPGTAHPGPRRACPAEPAHTDHHLRELVPAIQCRRLPPTPCRRGLPGRQAHRPRSLKGSLSTPSRHRPRLNERWVAPRAQSRPQPFTLD